MRNDIHTANGLTSAPGASARDVAVVNPRSLAERYVALWNEPDPDARRAMVRAPWTPASGCSCWTTRAAVTDSQFVER